MMQKTLHDRYELKNNGDEGTLYDNMGEVETG